MAASEKTGSAFVDRYGLVFGRPAAAMLKLAGLTEAEVEAQGAILIDATGRRWLDFGSFGIHLLGHRHPHVLTALRTQAEVLGLSSKILVNAQTVELGERLGKLVFGDAPSGVVFANSGSEANEIAIKIARLSTGRRRFVALNSAYHGRTDGALRLSQHYTQYFNQSPDEATRFVQAGDGPELEAALAGRDVAAVFIEPVQGEGGIHPLSPEYLTLVREACTRTGALLISDEIQSGLGRSGRLVGCPEADVVTLGKTLAGGFVPVAAAVFRTDVVGARARDPVVNASSYAGGALASAVGNAVLDVISAPTFLPELTAVGEAFRRKLTKTVVSREGVREVRGTGLMIGVEFDTPLKAGQVLLEAMRNGLLLSFCLSNPRTLRIYPPAVSAPQELERALDVVEGAVEHSVVDASYETERS